jgi:hypothetical protein
MSRLIDLFLWFIAEEEEPIYDNLLSGIVFMVLLFKPEEDE